MTGDGKEGAPRQRVQAKSIQCRAVVGERVFLYVSLHGAPPHQWSAAVAQGLLTLLYKRRRSVESYQIRLLRTVAAVVDASHAGQGSRSVRLRDALLIRSTD